MPRFRLSPLAWTQHTCTGALYVAARDVRLDISRRLLRPRAPMCTPEGRAGDSAGIRRPRGGLIPTCRSRAMTSPTDHLARVERRIRVAAGICPSLLNRRWWLHGRIDGVGDLIQFVGDLFELFLFWLVRSF